MTNRLNDLGHDELEIYYTPCHTSHFGTSTPTVTFQTTDMDIEGGAVTLEFTTFQTLVTDVKSGKYDNITEL